MKKRLLDASSGPSGAELYDTGENTRSPMMPSGGGAGGMGGSGGAPRNLKRSE